ncbi:hypothetical protein RFI_02062 [Reticulomyxa filosa]|uniref:Uncharacterized protein n=1 Tax=Reticulomyxa filosa TaxID=46433 RepID=X6PBG5_RETFI|nr:hypothetical protein RFI_02062 [Reticulomyxa filosa]|eukprot:ETO35012.1 hypothetical protein RFI_02062 [Reticulomyxa filosa]
MGARTDSCDKLCLQFDCAWLLHLTRGYLWKRPTAKRELATITSRMELQSISQIETRGGSRSVIIIPEENKKTSDIHSKIRWVVLLYIVSSIFVCMGSICERLAFGFSHVPGKACTLVLYVSCLRVVTDGCFFSFYLVRITVTLRGSVFAMSNYLQYFLWAAPIITYGTLVIVIVINAHINHCDQSDARSITLALTAVVCSIFWDVSLFLIFIYYLRKVEFFIRRYRPLYVLLTSAIGVQHKKFYSFFNYFCIRKNVTALSFLILINNNNNKKQVLNMNEIENQSYCNALKECLKKFFRLFIVSTLSTLTASVTIVRVSLNDLAWSALAIDLCVKCTLMLLSFAFANSVFNFLCLCKRNI